MSKQDGVTRDQFGPKLFIETGDARTSYCGPVAYTLQAVNDSGVRYVQSHAENGMSRVHAEGKYQLECGSKLDEKDVSFALISHNGDICTSSPLGFTRIFANQITLQANTEIVLDAPNIRIGNDKGATKEVVVIGQEVSLNINESNIKLGEKLKLSNIFKAFSGSMVTDVLADSMGVGNLPGGNLFGSA